MITVGPRGSNEGVPVSKTSVADARVSKPVQRQTRHWQSSLLGKFILACLSGVIVSYSIGILVGWIMITSASQEQWRNQALTNVQIATATLRNI